MQKKLSGEELKWKIANYSVEVWLLKLILWLAHQIRHIRSHETCIRKSKLLYIDVNLRTLLWRLGGVPVLMGSNKL
jgi:hypothetical protein